MCRGPLSPLQAPAATQPSGLEHSPSTARRARFLDATREVEVGAVAGKAASEFEARGEARPAAPRRAGRGGERLPVAGAPRPLQPLRQPRHRGPVHIAVLGAGGGLLGRAGDEKALGREQRQDLRRRGERLAFLGRPFPALRRLRPCQPEPDLWVHRLVRLVVDPAPAGLARGRAGGHAGRPGGRAAVSLSGTRPVIVETVPWVRRPDAAVVRASLARYGGPGGHLGPAVPAQVAAAQGAAP